MDLSGQTALVTGASGGIGTAIVRALAGAGAQVAIHYHSNRAAADALRAELPGGPHLVVGGDIARPDDVERLVADTVAGLGRLDILVNNAAIYVEHPVAEIDYAAWQQRFAQVIAVNLLGAANACYCAARQMILQGGGRIVNVGSRGGYRGEPRSTSYGASKAGLHALSQSLAQELGGYNIFVTAVAPGFVDGGMGVDALSGPGGAAIRAQSPLGRVAQPDEVAHTVLFLAAPGSEFLTGAVVDINGASYLR